MRAAVTTGDHRFEVVDLPDPIPEPHQLVIRVTSCGVCGSDIKAQPFAPAGMVMGHEFGGERGPWLGRGTNARAFFLGRRQESLAGRACIDHGAAHEVGRGAGHSQEHGRDQAAGRRFRDADRLLARLQFLADLPGQRQQRVHSINPSW